MSIFEVIREDSIATLWLNNPQKNNAMGEEFWLELPKIVEEIDADENIRVIIVAARGKNFSAGLDLKGGLGVEFNNFISGGLAHERQRLFRMILKMQKSFDVLSKSPKPVIAAVHGWCIGGGLDLISACDIRYCVKDAKISLRETRLAIVADVGSLQRLPGIIGKGHVRELAFSGRDFTAEEGERMGLFNKTFDDTKTMMDFVMEKAREIASNSPLAVQGAKRVLNQMDSRAIDEGLEYVALWNAAHLASEDIMEALMAFAEKRQPNFKGK